MLHFDVLPLHPRPLPLESLTGYLIRVAEANALPSVDTIAAACFPRQSRRNVRNFNDVTPLTLDDAALTLARSTAEMQQMTFYHLARKFGRSTHPQKLSRFLTGSIAPHLRWCPACLDEQPYYRLTWRFLTLTGCPDHGTALLDRCPHCCQPVPLFKAPLRIGYCPACGGDLCAGRAPIIDTHTAQTEAALLSRLLTAHPSEQNAAEVVKRLGRHYAQARNLMGLSGPRVAQALGVTHTVVQGIEFGNTDRRGCSFQDYRRYADFVGVDLWAVFGDAGVQGSGLHPS